MKKLSFLLLFAFLMPFSFGITIGGVFFDNIGFVDAIGTYSGTWSGTIANMVGTGNLANTSSPGQIRSTNTADYVNLLFTNNLLWNNAGADLAIFEASGAGTPGAAGCQVRVVINSIAKVYTPYWIEGVTYVAYINLDDFSIPLGTYITSIQITGYTCPEYVAATALHIPEPSTMILSGMICLGLFFLRKKL